MGMVVREVMLKEFKLPAEVARQDEERIRARARMDREQAEAEQREVRYYFINLSLQILLADTAATRAASSARSNGFGTRVGQSALAA
jgi:hypothetical protein